MGFINTFFTWRGAHHGKRTRQAIGAQTEFSRQTERAKWDARYPGSPVPSHLWTESEKWDAREPMHPVLWWTTAVLVGLLALTVMGLPIAVLMGIPLWTHSPYRARFSTEIETEPETMPLPTVPDPVQVYNLPSARPLAGAGRGRHAK